MSSKMLDLNGFSAGIMVGRNHLSQYKPEISLDGKTATCWIISEVGQKFSVIWRDNSIYRSVASSGRIYVDGLECGGKVIYASGDATHRKGKDDRVKKGYVTIGPETVRKFEFGRLDLTDDDTYFNSSTSQHLGEIKLEIVRVNLGRRKERTQRTRYKTFGTEDQKVHERSKKATSHRIKLGDEVKTGKRYSIASTPIDKLPVVTFIFKYRPIDVLQANNILPPPAFSVAHSLKRRVSDVVAKEEAINVQAGIRDEVTEAKPATAKRRKLKLKPERDTLVHGDVIDLT